MKYKGSYRIHYEQFSIVNPDVRHFKTASKDAIFVSDANECIASPPACDVNAICNNTIGGVAKGTSKILGLVNVSSDLEISTAFAKSLEVSFVEYLFRSRILTCFVSVSDFQTRVSASRRVSDFTIRHPSLALTAVPASPDIPATEELALVKKKYHNVPSHYTQVIKVL